MSIEIAAAFSGLKTAFELLKLGVAARDDGKIQAATLDMSARLLDAHQVALDMADRCGALQDRLHTAEAHARELERKADERRLYVLAPLGAGAFAYAAKDESGPGYRGQHYLCQPCYDQGIKAVLRHDAGAPQSPGRGYVCPHNGEHTIPE
mgnify:CR=1 FL=1